MIVPRSKVSFGIAACVSGLLALTAGRAGAQGLSVKEFEKLHGDLTAVKEAWQTIPWQLTLLDARVSAAKDKKPIYMLCRSGHPLGCV